MIVPIAAICAIIAMIGATLYAIWPDLMASANKGYVVWENQTNYVQIKTFDDRGEQYVNSLIDEGWTMIGVAGRGDIYTLTRGNSTR